MQAQVLIFPKERIRNILKSKPVDRIGIFDLDMEPYAQNSPKTSDKFFLFTFNGPFQSLSLKIGLEQALIKFAQEPRHTLSFFKESQKKIIEKYKSLKAEGFEFDGAWMGEDIAYDKGLYFSVEKYRNQLLGIHRDLSDFFTAEGLPLFFHCDGKVEDLIPLLVGARIAAIHPVQEKSNPSLLKLKKDFEGQLTFTGGVGLHRLEQERQKLLEYIKILKEGGNYIFSFDGPVPESYNRQNYDSLIKEAESHGAYR